MKQLYRPLLLVSILATAPAVLIGCGGGSSSNQPAKTTRADVAFSINTAPDNSKLKSTIRPIKVRGVYTDLVSPETGFPFAKGNGVYTYGAPDSDIFNAVVNTKNGINRALILQRVGSNNLSPAVATVYNLAEFNKYQLTFSVDLGDGKGYKLYSSADFGDNSSGTVVVLARVGTLVTLRFDNAKIVYLGTGPNEAEILILNGTFTYDANDLQPNLGQTNLSVKSKTGR